MDTKLQVSVMIESLRVESIVYKIDTLLTYGLDLGNTIAPTVSITKKKKVPFELC